MSFVRSSEPARLILTSRPTGSEITLSSLLRANAHQEVVRALANPHALHDPRLKAALAHGLCVLANSMADVVGHSHGSIRAYTSEHLAETKVALNFHFQYECLDVYFPLLDDSSPQTSLSISQLIGAAVLTDAHRTAIIECKNHGGWEKHDLIYQAANGKHGAWVLRHLVGMTQRKDVKTQEVALSALGALAMDNPTVANILAKTSLEGDHHPGHSDRTTALSVIQVVNRILSSPSEQPQNQIKACYTLYSLIRDERDFCIEAADHGVLASLASLVKSLTPLENTCDWEIDEPEYRVSLREATLKAIAAISLFDKVIKREVADTYDLMPIIQACLTQKNVGVRCSACHCLCSLSRDTAVIRTNITDSGAGMALYQMFKKEDEDVRATAVRWPRLANDSDPEIQEQAFAIQRNLTEDETGVSLVFETMGDDTRITTYVLRNVANSSRSQQDHIFTHPHIFDGMHHCLADACPGARVPLVGCLLTLLRTKPRRKRDLIEAGYVSTLRHLCERTGGGTGVGGIGSLTTGTSPDDRDAAVVAKQVLDLMDSSTIGEML
ncbi:ARM repeat-containing protein [Pisolithus albus]|nr:ARM repeat-containing protein [Pisolithus albus]